MRVRDVALELDQSVSAVYRKIRLATFPPFGSLLGAGAHPRQLGRAPRVARSVEATR